MTRTYQILLPLACLAAAAAAAQEIRGFEAADLADACRNLVLAARGVQAISQEDPGAMLCLGYLAGWFQAMELHVSDVHRRGEEPPYCWPERTPATASDVAALLVDYVEAHPDSGAPPAHSALLQATTEAFPCARGPAPAD